MVRRRRQTHMAPAAPPHPQYEWAFDVTGQPIHITQAVPAGAYLCPVCGGKMVARLGEIKRHHFAHDQLKFCTPETVASAAAGRWLTGELQRLLGTRRSIMLSWPCPLCQQTHTADLLDGVTQVQQHEDEDSPDIILLDAAGTMRAAIGLKTPASRALAAAAQGGIMALALDANNLGQRMQDVPTLLAGTTIYGGVCTMQQAAARGGFVTDAPTLRRLLVEAVKTPPYNIYGPLTDHDGLSHVLILGQRRLWLPPILWQRAIGGLHHTISPALQIVSQEWPQDDGGVIALYYVTARDTHAVAVRRFGPNQPVYARLGSGIFRTGQLTATGVARSFAEL